jgi:Protein of unknown function (DUF429)
MKIYGIDFTSAPSLKKAITYAQCHISEKGFVLERLGCLTSFDEFENFLRQLGPWVAGLDFPFGQPRRLIENLHWPRTWDGYVGFTAQITKFQFVETLTNYCNGRNKGDKHHLRLTDQLANARSPMMLYRVPVAKMFFEGASRLLKAGVNIQPCLVRDDPRLVVEAYPALVARRWASRGGYKSDAAKQQTAERQSAREEILRGLRSSDAKKHFGFDVHFSDQHANVFVQDSSGDQLDAFLCAIQAGWAYSQRNQNFGVPRDCDPLEGWIVDPLLAYQDTPPGTAA